MGLTGKSVFATRAPDGRGLPCGLAFGVRKICDFGKSLPWLASTYLFRLRLESRPAAGLPGGC